MFKINNGRRCNYLTIFVSFSLSSRSAGLVQHAIYKIGVSWVNQRLWPASSAVYLDRKSLRNPQHCILPPLVVIKQNNIMLIFRITSLLLLCVFTNTYAQKELHKDLDFDGKIDTVYLDIEQSKIVCILSSKNFKREESKVIDMLNENSSIKDAKNGFYFNNDWMRSGYSNQFRYNKNQKKIQLIGMSRYEYGNAANEGSGESSVNLLTDNYIGNWNHYDIDKNTLVELPSIKANMHFNNIFLVDFNDEVYFDYGLKCANLFNNAVKVYEENK